MIADISDASQDYLKAIYKMTAVNGRASTSKLADCLNVAPASVTNMLQKMAGGERPLVDYQKHQGVTLTADGRQAALEMLRHHRLLELFLHDILGFSWDEVHEEAERLEHCISEKMEQRIADLLGNPRHDPHGSPIPNRNLEMSAPRGRPLTDLRSGATAVICRVNDEDNDMLRYMDKLGLHLNTTLTVVDYIPYDQNLHLQIEGREGTAVIGSRIAQHIFVDEKEES